MYKEYFNLSKNPFENTPNPEFFFLGGDYRETLALLKYTVVERKGATCIAGPIGCGKTMLAKALIENLPDESIVISPSAPKGTQKDLAVYIASKLELQNLPESQLLIHEMMKTKLIELNEQGKICVLIFDESQFLDDALFEEILFLANLETEQFKLIQIILLGQMELLEKLNNPARHQLAQRITKTKILSPLNRAEAEQYIKHRLKISGASREIFSQDAIEFIVRDSSGIPRNINKLCDTSMLNAFITQKSRVEVNDVRKAGDDIGLKVFGKPSLQLPANHYSKTPGSDHEFPKQNEKIMKKKGLSFSIFGHNALLVSAVLIVAAIILVAIFAKHESPSPAGIQKKGEIAAIEDKALEKKSDVKTEVEDIAALKKPAAVLEERVPAESMPLEEEKSDIDKISQHSVEEQQEVFEESQAAGEETMGVTEEFQTAEENNNAIPETLGYEIEAESPSTPYTILLSSFRKLPDVKRALRYYEQAGLSPFWTRVDLRGKGVWYGVFAGHYENSEQAEDEISKFHLTDAVAKKAEYTVLIGEYDSEIEAGIQMNALAGEGVSTYLIHQSNGKLNLYSGAFYTEEAAVNHSFELTVVGPICTVVKR